MIKKILTISENSFAIVILLSIIAVTVASVIALNPKVYQDDSFNQQVAGIQTDNSSQLDRILTLPVKVYDNNLSLDGYDAKLQTNSRGGYTYQAKFNLQREGNIKHDFVKIENPNDFPVQARINTQILGNISDVLRINIEDKLDTLVLFDTINFERNITIPAKSSREFKINYEFLDNIFFPFEISFDIK